MADTEAAALDPVPRLYALRRDDDGEEPATVLAWGLAFADGRAVTLWLDPYPGAGIRAVACKPSRSFMPPSPTPTWSGQTERHPRRASDAHPVRLSTVLADDDGPRWNVRNLVLLVRRGGECATPDQSGSDGGEEDRRQHDRQWELWRLGGQGCSGAGGLEVGRSEFGLVAEQTELRCRRQGCQRELRQGCWR
jgi:hypothetical protein